MLLICDIHYQDVCTDVPLLAHARLISLDLSIDCLQCNHCIGLEGHGGGLHAEP